MKTILIPLNQLRENKLRTSQMTEEQLEKLKENIKRQGKYPPLIVREIKGTEFDKKYTESPLSGYRIIDGHNRKLVLEQLGYKEARCEVWDIDDKTELLLLATLNELRGTSDFAKRALLLHQLEIQGIARNSLLKLVPEDKRRFEFLLSIIDRRKSIERIGDELAQKNAEIEAKRQAIIEKYLKEGLDQKKAEAIADILVFQEYVPKIKSGMEGKKKVRFSLTFYFDNRKDYELACKFFEYGEKKEPNTAKLLKLIKENL